MTADQADPGRLLSVTDAAYTPTRMLEIDTTSSPAQIVGEVTLTEDGAPVGLDGGGLYARPDGGVLARGQERDRPENALVRLDEAGAIVERTLLPEDIGAALGSSGLEGVTAIVDPAGTSTCGSSCNASCRPTRMASYGSGATT